MMMTFRDGGVILIVDRTLVAALTILVYNTKLVPEYGFIVK